MKLNEEMCDRYKGLTIYDCENEQFPYFVREWDEAFTEEEIKGYYRDDMDFANIITEEVKPKLYVLTETDSTDTTWCYNEIHRSMVSAIKRMKQLYHENVVERSELVVSSEYDEKAGKASAEMVDGITIAWNVKECDIL